MEQAKVYCNDCKYFKKPIRVLLILAVFFIFFILSFSIRYKPMMFPFAFAVVVSIYVILFAFTQDDKYCSKKIRTKIICDHPTHHSNGFEILEYWELNASNDCKYFVAK